MLALLSYPCAIWRPRSALPYSHIPLTATHSPTAGWLRLPPTSQVQLCPSPPSVLVLASLAPQSPPVLHIPLAATTAILRNTAVMLVSNDQTLPASPTAKPAAALPFTVIVLELSSTVRAKALFNEIAALVPPPPPAAASDLVDDAARMAAHHYSEAMVVDAYNPTFEGTTLKDAVIGLLLSPDYEQLTADLREVVRGDEGVRAVLREAWGWDGA